MKASQRTSAFFGSLFGQTNTVVSGIPLETGENALIEIDRYGLFGTDTDISAIHGLIADTYISKIST